MSSNIAIIPQFAIAADMAEQFAAFTGQDDLNQGVSGGFPVMSLRGAKWRIVEGGEEHPICMPGTKDLAPYVKVVILRANASLSKTYYAGAFVEGSDAKPDCSSNAGVVPSLDSPNIQAPSCATCPQNVWGSKISPSGAKIKVCADVRRLAILPADDLEYDPILLRIPGASLSDLANYGKALKQRGIPYGAVVTKLSFDPDASFPKVMFQFERVLTPAEMQLVAGRLGEPMVEDVLGTPEPAGPVALAAPAAPAEDKFGIPADVVAPAAVTKDAEMEAAVSQVEAQAAPAPAPAPAAKKRASKGFGGGAAAAEAAPAEAAPAPAAAKPAAQPATTTPAGGNMLSEIEDALGSLGL